MKGEIKSKVLKRRSKRVIDFIVSSIGLLFLFPLLALIGILIKMDSEGKVFFKHKRIGKDGKPFFIYKFRSMVKNASKMGPEVTYQNDPRITRVGEILRETKLDELPQLINVWKGDMSFVGPRPESPRYVEQYTEEQRQVLKIKPGITGPTQIEWRNESSRLKGENLDEYYMNEIVPQKLALDLEYVYNSSLYIDLKLLLRTLRALFSQTE